MAPHKKLRKLTAKQQAFVEHYLANGGNGTQAAISAGYSEDSAVQLASEMLVLPHIRAELALKGGTALQKLDLGTGVEAVLAELKRIAFGTPPDGLSTRSLDEVQELERIYRCQAGRVAELSRIEVQNKDHSVRLSNELERLTSMAARIQRIRATALDRLGETLQLFNRHTVHNTTNNVQVNSETYNSLTSKELAALARTQMKPVNDPAQLPEPQLIEEAQLVEAEVVPEEPKP